MKHSFAHAVNTKCCSTNYNVKMVNGFVFECLPQEMAITSTRCLPWRILVTISFAHKRRTGTAQFISHCTACATRLPSYIIFNENKHNLIDLCSTVLQLGDYWLHRSGALPEVPGCHHIPPTSARESACPRFSDWDRWLCLWP